MWFSNQTNFKSNGMQSIFRCCYCWLQPIMWKHRIFFFVLFSEVRIRLNCSFVFLFCVSLLICISRLCAWLKIDKKSNLKRTLEFALSSILSSHEFDVPFIMNLVNGQSALGLFFSDLERQSICHQLKMRKFYGNHSSFQLYSRSYFGELVEIKYRPEHEANISKDKTKTTTRTTKNYQPQ